MKKIIVLLVSAAMAATMSAQQIAVVSSNGNTTMCQTLADAISNAASNSVVYLPAGGFQISDDVKITKKLTIIGVTHKANSDNVEGNTIISGNLNFNGGSSNSAVMGCYIAGNVNIGYDDSEISGILIKYCNLNSVQVNGTNVTNTKINQNYIRNESNFNNASVVIKNNILHSVYQITGGEISYNIVTSNAYHSGTIFAFYYVNDATISNNVILDPGNIHRGGNCQATGNLLCNRTWGDDSYSLGLENWDGVFEKNSGVTPASDYHFSGNYAEYNSKAGLYAGGTGFSDGCLPPVPYVSVKNIDEQTDAQGNLTITLRVKAAGENE